MTPAQKAGGVIAVGVAILLGTAWWYNSTKAPKACNENADCDPGSDCVENVCQRGGGVDSVNLNAVRVS